MCLLTYFEPGVMPNTDHLANGAIINDDGHGWAIVHDGRILIGQSMVAEVAIDAFESARKLYPAGPALFHSRWGTHGAMGLDNVHPFYVDGDRRTVLAHNGILPADVQPRNGDPRSDTAILAASMAGRFGALRKPAVRAAVETWMGKTNKLVVLTVNQRYGRNAFILNEDAGTWTPEGIWYSNDGYLPSGKRWASALGWDDDDFYVSGKSYSYQGGTWYSTGAPGVSQGGYVRSEADVADRPCWICNGGPDECTCYDVSTQDRPSISKLPVLNGDMECYSCHNPKRGCTCEGFGGTGRGRCPGCFYWLTKRDLEFSMCGVCNMCLDCVSSAADCDCYVPASVQRAAADVVARKYANS